MRHEEMDKVALDRYKVVKSKATLWPCAVVAGDGSQELFSGSESTCNHVARKLVGAFLDGAFYVHSQHQKELEASIHERDDSGDEETELSKLYRRARRQNKEQDIDTKIKVVEDALQEKRVRDRRKATPPSCQQSAAAELSEIKEKTAKLATFLDSKAFFELNEVKRSLLVEKWKVMNQYGLILSQQIEEFGPI